MRHLTPILLLPILTTASLLCTPNPCTFPIIPPSSTPSPPATPDSPSYSPPQTSSSSTTTTHLYICTSPSWGGSCTNLDVEVGQCVDMESAWDDDVESAGPDEGTFCVLYS